MYATKTNQCHMSSWVIASLVDMLPGLAFRSTSGQVHCSNVQLCVLGMDLAEYF